MQCAKRTLKDTLYVKFIVNPDLILEFLIYSVKYFRYTITLYVKFIDNPDLILEFLIYSVKYFRHSITNHLQKLPGTTPLRMKIKEAMHK
ncbi:hypothetical protein CICLE_v10023080mg [Citrus x clementina]|uniref:Uncharacterized protein n=1 Tax=Citrus clementina TaxID=85681 RepID=V4T2L8_CITCL|nr:hypothetical protein CICLE_v10023080mg [Citrus x clementina]